MARLEAEAREDGPKVSEGSLRLVLPLQHVQCSTDISPPTAFEKQYANLQVCYDRVSLMAKIALRPASNQVLQNSTSVFYQDALVVESDLPAPSSADVDWKRRKSVFSTTLTGLDAIPSPVAEVLFGVYLDKILPQYPIFNAEDLREICHNVYQDERSPSQCKHCDIFIILMILAISTMTSGTPDYRKPASLAESLHQSASRYTDWLAATSIRSLQCIMLLIQLGYLLPHTGNLIHLVSEAMRMATELGLHMEPAENLRLAPKDANFRRGLFWLVYAMDRSVNTSCLSRRRSLLRDEHIHVALPAGSEEEKAMHLGVSAAKKLSRVQFINSVRYRQFQSEISTVQFYNTKLPSIAYADWVAETERRVFAWRLHALSGGEAPPDWFDFGTWFVLLILHRPCPGNPTPSLGSVRYCITAAAHISAGYLHTARHGFLKFPWHGVHNCFEAGTILLYNIISHAEVFRSDFYVEYQQALDVLNQLSEVFLVLSQRWPTARQSKDLFDSLKAKVLGTQFAAQQDHHTSGTELLETLRNVVFQRGNYGSSGESQFGLDANPELGGNWVDDLLQPSDELPPWLHWSTDMLTTSLDFDYMDLAFMIGPGTLPDSFGGQYLPLSSPLIETPPPSYNSHGECPFDDSDVRYVQDAFLHLPSCSNCRYRRIKCDRKFPACGHCSKMHKDCRISDPVLSQEISRPYLHSLRESFQRHSSAKHSGDVRRGSERGQILVQDELKPSPEAATAAYVLILAEFVPGGMADTLFFGPSSVFSQVLHTTSALREVEFGEDCQERQQSMDNESLYIELSTPFHKLLSPSLLKHFTELFYHSVGSLLPFLGRDQIRKAQQACQEQSENTPDEPNSLTFCLMMAISTRIISKRDSHLAATSTAFFQAATRDSVTFAKLVQQPTNPGLQFIVLLCFYLLLDPLAGNVWRTLGHACRTCTDLSYDSAPSYNEQKVDWRLYSTLFRLEW